jgi:hypothetical protein
MAREHVDDVRERMQSTDIDRYMRLYGAMRYAFGMKWDSSGVPYNSRTEDFPYFPDIRVTRLAIGQSRRILNAALLSLSRVMTGEPEPEFPQVDSVTGELRKQVFLERYRQGAWWREYGDQFVDMDNFGEGFVEYGPMKNKRTGKDYTAGRNVPITQVIYDRHTRNFGQARWAACIHYTDPKEAIAAYGDDAVRGSIREAFDPNMRKAHKYVRITTYYSNGVGSSSPTYMVFVGNWRNKPVVSIDNPYPRLPVAYGEYMSVAGMPRPFGKVLLQQSTQEAINELELSLRAVVKHGTGIDVFDLNQLHDDDVAALAAGKPMTRIRLKNADPSGRPPVLRIPSMEVANALLQLLAIYERQYSADSNTTEQDRSSAGPASRSATSDQLLDMRSQQGQSLTKRQTLLMYQRNVETATMVMGLADEDPLLVDVLGMNLPVNDPAHPNLSMQAVMEEPSRVLIGQQAVEPQDVSLKQHQRLAALERLAKLVNLTVNPMKYTEETLKAIGEKDLNEWIMQPQAPTADPNAQAVA